MKIRVLGLLAIIACTTPVVAAAKPASFGCDRSNPEAMLNWLAKKRPTLEQARLWLSSCTHVVGPDEITTKEIRTDNSRLFPHYDATRQRIIGGTFQ